MLAFLAKHGSGFLLHMAGAVAIMALGYWAGWPFEALIVNTLHWPTREALQHHGFKNIWTFHRLLEWVPAVAVGLIMYAALQ